MVFALSRFEAREKAPREPGRRRRRIPPGRTVRLLVASVLLTYGGVMVLTLRAGEAEGLWCMGWMLSIPLQGLAALAFTTFATPRTVTWAQRVLLPVAAVVGLVLLILCVRGALPSSCLSP